MRTKRKIGLILLSIVIVCWISVPVLPFFDFPNKAIIITSLLVSGEVLFVITIALLGKEYWEKIKTGFKLIIKGNKKNKTQKQQYNIMSFFVKEYR